MPYCTSELLQFKKNLKVPRVTCVNLWVKKVKRIYYEFEATVLYQDSCFCSLASYHGPAGSIPAHS